MRKSILFGTALLAISLLGTSCGAPASKEDSYTKDGKLKVSMRNLYFTGYTGGDSYVKEIEEQFGLKFSFASYSWTDWKTQVQGAVNARTTQDVFHADIDSYNYVKKYKLWAEQGALHALPDDLTRWPNLKNMLDNTSNIDSLKINGHLYGIPISKNTTDFSTDFSPFTYIYRRDWAKEWGVYQENDVYTWRQFEALLKKFKEELNKSNRFALGDVEWGYPSITNFYKQVPHCFAQDDEGIYVNNYTTDQYIKGLQKSKQFRDDKYYYQSANTLSDGQMRKKYVGNQCGVFYENLSYSNFVAIKLDLEKSNSSNKEFNIDDATAIMKIKAPTADDFDTAEEKEKYVSPYGGKYCLEGTDNWFSLTLFDGRISDNKVEKMLDLYDWLLSEEGTRFSIYGFENYDYEIVDGQVKLIEEAWPKTKDGKYAEKSNGGTYLRYMVSLGYDNLSKDPLTDKEAVAYLEAWEQEMRDAKDADKLYVLKETDGPNGVMWLATPKKSKECGDMRDLALINAKRFVAGSNGITSIEKFKATFGKIWDEVLEEINAALNPTT